MKKISAIILACILAITILAACGGKDNPASDRSNSPQNPPADSTTQNTAAPASAGTAVKGASTADSFDTSRVIAVFTREEGSGTRDAFASITGVGEDMYIEAVVISETNEILTKVEETDYAISYVSVGSLNPRVKALSINGIAPSDTTILNGSYALQRPFLVCVNEANSQNALAQDFITFMLSAEGQEIVATKWTKLEGSASSYTASGMSGTLKVGGSTSVEPLMQSLRQAYIALNPNVEIEISGGGSGVGISEATSGLLDIGMSSRGLKDNEKEALTGYQIALDGVAVIVNPANPMTDITIEQVKDIFTGETIRWDAVG